VDGALWKALKCFVNTTLHKAKYKQAVVRGKKEIADYVLVYKGIKLAIIEAKSDLQEVGEGVMQAKKYAEKLQLETTYSSNGIAVYQICMKTGVEGLVTDFLSPEELWNKTFSEVQNGLERKICQCSV
jgi:type I restriction enzyme, R subunit